MVVFWGFGCSGVYGAYGLKRVQKIRTSNACFILLLFVFVFFALLVSKAFGVFCGFVCLGLRWLLWSVGLMVSNVGRHWGENRAAPNRVAFPACKRVQKQESAGAFLISGLLVCWGFFGLGAGLCVWSAGAVGLLGLLVCWGCWSLGLLVCGAVRRLVFGVRFWRRFWGNFWEKCQSLRTYPRTFASQRLALE